MGSSAWASTWPSAKSRPSSPQRALSPTQRSVCLPAAPRPRAPIAGCRGGKDGQRWGLRRRLPRTERRTWQRTAPPLTARLFLAQACAVAAGGMHTVIVDDKGKVRAHGPPLSSVPRRRHLFTPLCALLRSSCRRTPLAAMTKAPLAAPPVRVVCAHDDILPSLSLPSLSLPSLSPPALAHPLLRLLCSHRRRIRPGSGQWPRRRPRHPGAEAGAGPTRGKFCGQPVLYQYGSSPPGCLLLRRRLATATLQCWPTMAPSMPAAAFA